MDMLGRILLLCLSACVISGEFTLTIMHTNDVHARFEPIGAHGAVCKQNEAGDNQCFGGVARRIAAINQIRSSTTEPNPILLDAGDQYQGSFWFLIHKGSAAAHFMKLAQYDAMALGNHEFDLGVKGLLPFLKNVTFPILSANIDTSEEPDMNGLFEKSTILTVGGEKIGLVGFTTQETEILSSPGKVEFNDEVEAVKSEVERLTGEGVNKIIGLGHSGISIDKQLAASIPGLDVVVGGHSNTFLYTGDPPSDEVPLGPYPTVVEQTGGDKVLVVQDYAFGKYLGHLQVTFDDQGRVSSWKGNPILLDNSITEDEAALNEMKKWKSALNSLSDEVLGKSHVLLDGRRETCRLGECNLGNFITDAMVHIHLAHPDQGYWGNASIALINSGNIRASIQKGDIKVEDVLTVQPYQNKIDLVELKGRHLLEVLEHSVRDFKTDDPSGKFLQVSGLQIKYDVSKSNGQRVVSVNARCLDCHVPMFEPLEKDKSYKIAVSHFHVGGGEGYDMIAEHMLSHHEFGNVDSDVTMQYVRAMSPIITGIEGRIQFVDGAHTDRDTVCTNTAMPCVADTVFLFWLCLSSIWTFWVV